MSTSFLTSSSPNDFIDSLPRKKEWSLDSMRLLAQKLAIRPEQFKAVHITGSNGKGSVAAFVSSILRSAGFKVGTYTSPHLLDARERITINGQKISEKKFDELALEVKRVVEKIPEEQAPSFFEAITAMAFLHFQREKVDFVVAEVGLGGRLDSTNLLRPLVAVITNVSLEHTKILGKTVSEISREKAGIIKPGVSVVTGAEGIALKQIKNFCREKKAELEVVRKKDLKKIVCSEEQTCFEFEEGKSYSTTLLGPHQATNAALAVKAIDLLRRKAIRISEKAVQEGLQETVWRGRLEIVSRKPLVVLDGAHNPAAGRTLARALETIWGGNKTILVAGMLSDKDVKGFLKALSRISVKKVIATQSDSKRALEAEKLARVAERIFGKKRVSVIPTIKQAVEKAKKICGKKEIVLVTGSLYTVGEAIRE